MMPLRFAHLLHSRTWSSIESWKRELNLALLDDALERLAQVTPGCKRTLLEACADCIAADGKVTAREGELLRAVADALDCPMPPLLAGQPVQ